MDDATMMSMAMSTVDAGGGGGAGGAGSAVAAEKRFHSIMGWLNSSSRETNQSGRDAVINEALAIIKKSPVLASVKYDKRGMRPIQRQYWDQPPDHVPYDYSVLYLLAYCGATRKQIQLVYNLHPKPKLLVRWTYAEYIRILEGYSSCEVATFLLERNPDLASKGDLKECHSHHASIPRYTPFILFPFHVAVLRYMRHSTAEEEDQASSWLTLAHKLMQICNISDENTLKWALNARCPDPAMEMILQNLLEPITVFDASVPATLVISLRGAKWVARILPQLEHFTSIKRNGFATQDSFVCLMESMAIRANNLKSLSLELSSSWLQQDSPALHSLQQMMTACPCLEEIHFFFGNQEEHDHSRIIEFICRSLASRQQTQPIESLRLEGFTLRRGTTLPLMIASGAGVKQLELDRFRMQFAAFETTATTTTPTTTPSSCLEELCMKNFSTSNPDFIKSMILHAATSQSLRHLKLCPESIPLMDVTSEVVELLDQSNQLQQLTLSSRKLQVDLSQIYDTLLKNTSLHVLNVLAPKKTSKQAEMEKIKYYTQLNSYGRKAAQDPKTTKHELIQLLLVVPKKAGSIQRTSFHYGLLHENPSIWT